MQYVALNGVTYELEKLTATEKVALSEISKASELAKTSKEFTRIWTKRLRSLYATNSPNAFAHIMRTDAYYICKDIDMRVHIRLHGYLDYRDALWFVASKKFSSERKFAQFMGISQGTVSKIFNKQIHLKIDSLQRVLAKMQCRLAIIGTEENPKVYVSY